MKKPIDSIFDILQDRECPGSVVDVVPYSVWHIRWLLVDELYET